MAVADQTNYRSAVREAIVEAVTGTSYNIVADYVEGSYYTLPFANVSLLPVTFSMDSLEDGDTQSAFSVALPFRVYGKYNASDTGVGGVVLETIEQHLVRAAGTSYSNSRVYVEISGMKITTTAYDTDADDQTTGEYILLGEVQCNIAYKATG